VKRASSRKLSMEYQTMIEQTKTRAKLPAITSNRWHVVHARWCGTPKLEPFERSIVSEHDAREEAVEAAKSLLHTLRNSAGDRPLEERDQVFVRRPNFKSLAYARRRERKRT
jgi:hypothetical protein